MLESIGAFERVEVIKWFGKDSPKVAHVLTGFMDTVWGERWEEEVGVHYDIQDNGKTLKIFLFCGID